jgi:class 3 adenylate cyclase/tetratricopeptide (TPR) repeat protein
VAGRTVVFVATCPNCGEENPDKAKFCSECASPLYAAPLPPAEERKVVSVLFVDLIGFTARSHDADPEDVRAALAPYHRLLKREIERFGGTVEKFIGDAVMAVFGAPVAHEDDAERAVRSALRITEAIEELKESNRNVDFSIRTAVNTGEGLVNLSAQPQAGEGMVTGDVVNTASRLQNIAPVNGVVVGEVTHRSTTDFISYESLGSVIVKGKPEPIPVWRAISARSNFGVDVQMAAKTPFIGRKFDLDALKNAYRRTLREDSVQLVTITGEPGVGKTRLLAEFSSFIDDQNELVYWRQGRSLPYGEGITFWALGEIVKAQAGILESDSPELAADKLRVAVDAVVEDTDESIWFATRLGPLVATKASRSGGGADKEESFTAWRRFLEAIASRSPLVVVFEDLHWADEVMLEFIDHLVEWSTAVPLLVVCTARPELYELHQGWGGGKRNSNTISLSPLSDSETTRLISALLSEAVLPAEVHAALLERAGGNPLYTEEFIRMLSDRGILKSKGRVLRLDPDADIPMPDNVHALIAARLDTLSAERKALLHDASVAGKVFWSGAVSALGGRDDREVREGLHELSRKELVRPTRNSSIEGQQEYSFWHALVRDVSYGQIPRAMRAQKHGAIAQWIETIAGDRVADHADVLAYHYETALELARATDSIGDEELLPNLRRFLVVAGDRALPLDSTKAALSYKKALMHFSWDDPDRAVVISKCARASLNAGELVDADSLYEQAIDRLVAAGNNVRAGESLVELSSLAWEQGRGQEEVLSLMNRGIGILEGGPRGAELARAYSHMSRFETISKGNPVKGMEWADRALALVNELQAPEVSVSALCRRGTARLQFGDEEGVLDLRESVRLGLKLGLGLETAITYTNLVDYIGSLEGPGRALGLAQEAVAFMRQRGIFGEMMWVEGNICGLIYELGDWDEVLNKTGNLIMWCKEHQAVLVEVQVSVFKATVHVWRGQLSEAETLERSFLEAARTVGDPQSTLPALITAAMTSAARSNLARAIELVEEFEVCGRNSPRSLAFRLPDALRLCQTAKAVDRAASLLKNADPDIKHLRRYFLSGQAIFAEMEEHIEHALSLYVEAARRWKDFGHVLEEGLALLGAGRCFLAMGDGSAAGKPLQEASAIFQRLGAVPLLNEVNGYLGQTEAV